MSTVDAAALAPPAPAAGIEGRKMIAFLAMVFGMFMAILDIQIVSASLAEIQAGLNAGADEISWVQTSYLIAEVIMIPLSGTLARILSTRILFSFSAAGFTAASVLAGAGDGEVTVRGWVYRTRSSGKLAFVVIRDATGILQCTVSQAKVTEGDFAAACKALRESSVIVTGTPAADDRAPGGFELRATRFEVLHYAETFPITKDLGDEHLLDNRHLWLRSRSMVDALKVRATAFGAFRGFWDSQEIAEISL